MKYSVSTELSYIDPDTNEYLKKIFGESFKPVNMYTKDGIKIVKTDKYTLTIFRSLNMIMCTPIDGMSKFIIDYELMSVYFYRFEQEGIYFYIVDGKTAQLYFYDTTALSYVIEDLIDKGIIKSEDVNDINSVKVNPGNFAEIGIEPDNSEIRTYDTLKEAMESALPYLRSVTNTLKITKTK